jgi:hypothetical protein
VAATRSAAFAAAVRMIDRIHGDATHGRAHASPTLGASLAQLLEVVL